MYVGVRERACGGVRISGNRLNYLSHFLIIKGHQRPFLSPEHRSAPHEKVARPGAADAGVQGRRSLRTGQKQSRPRKPGAEHRDPTTRGSAAPAGTLPGRWAASRRQARAAALGRGPAS